MRKVIAATVAAMAMCAFSTATASAYQWSVSMSGTQQTASGTPGDPDGSGTATITGDPATNTLCSTVTWSNISGPVVGGHIHEGAKGQPENPAVTINLFGPNVTGAASGVSGCTTLPAAVMQQMAQRPQLFLVVVHNQEFPWGALRGQLGSGPLCGAISQALCVGL